MNTWFAVGVTSLLFAAIHLPIWIFVLKYSAFEVLLQFMVSVIFAAGNGALFAMTESVVGPIITHVVWGWAVVLFR
jgi:membrane protease YdiL (CAAX protease family)